MSGKWFGRCLYLASWLFVMKFLIIFSQWLGQRVPILLIWLALQLLYVYWLCLVHTRQVPYFTHSCDPYWPRKEATLVFCVGHHQRWGWWPSRKGTYLQESGSGIQLLCRGSVKRAKAIVSLVKNELPQSNECLRPALEMQRDAAKAQRHSLTFRDMRHSSDRNGCFSVPLHLASNSNLVNSRVTSSPIEYLFIGDRWWDFSVPSRPFQDAIAPV